MTGRVLERVILMPKVALWEGWRLHFSTLGNHFGDPGVPKDTPKDTWGTRPAFLSILGRLWHLPWTHFVVILVTFS